MRSSEGLDLNTDLVLLTNLAFESSPPNVSTTILGLR
jgi:hypothetical protein